MIITTTPTIEGHHIVEYKGIAFGEVISGVNVLKDLGASFRDFFGISSVVVLKGMKKNC